MRNRFHFALASILAASIAAAPLALAQEQPSRERSRAVILSREGHSYLGVGVAEIDSERARALNLKEERGVEIKSVAKDSPAEKAGLAEGDVVLDYNGQPVQGIEQFQRLVRETPAGRTVKLTVWRGGSAHSLTATLEARKGSVLFRGEDGEYSFTMPPIPPIPEIPRIEMTWRNSTLGIVGESLNSQLAGYFGVKSGVLVRSVVENSAAEKAGLKAGDVITKVDATAVASPREISNALRAPGEGGTVTLAVVRERKEMTIPVTVERPASSRTRVRSPYPPPAPPAPPAPPPQKF